MLGCFTIQRWSNFLHIPTNASDFSRLQNCGIFPLCNAFVLFAAVLVVVCGWLRNVAVVSIRLVISICNTIRDIDVTAYLGRPSFKVWSEVFICWDAAIFKRIEDFGRFLLCDDSHYMRLILSLPAFSGFPKYFLSKWTLRDTLKNLEVTWISHW